MSEIYCSVSQKCVLTSYLLDFLENSNAYSINILFQGGYFPDLMISSTDFETKIIYFANRRTLIKVY